MRRWACSLAVGCGGSLRHIARLLACLFLLPIPQASLKRWMEDIGAPLPTPEERLRHLLALPPAMAWPLDGSYPGGTDPGMRGGKDEPDRLWRTHAAASTKGDDARQGLPRFKDCGLKVRAAFADDSPSCTAALTAVSPQARCQAEHFPTVPPSWGHRKKSLLSYRRQVQARGEAQQDEGCRALAQK